MAFDTEFDQHREQGALLPIAAREKTSVTTPPRSALTPNRMTATRRALLTVLVCGLITLGLASALGHRVEPCMRDSPEQARLADSQVKHLTKAHFFHRFLNTFFPERSQDEGLYASYKNSIDDFSADDAELPHALNRLARRQNNNTAPASSATPSSTATAAAPSSTPPASATATPTPSPPPSPSTPRPAPGQESSSQPAQPAPASPTVSSTPAASPLPSDNNLSSTTTAVLPERTTSFSEVRATITSTASNGNVVIVTATSMVAVTLGPASTQSPTSGGGRLQSAAPPVGRLSMVLSLCFAAFIAGVTLLL